MGSEAAQLDLSGESDESIVLFMGAGTPQERSQAFSEFHRRQAEYLYGVIRRWCRMNRGHLLEPDDLFQEVIWHVYNHADTYEPRGNGDPEVERRNLRAWLGTITVNQIKSKLRGERLGFQLVDISILEEIGREPFVLPQHVLEEDTPGHQMELLLDALSSLSDKEQDVLRLLWLEKDWRKP